MAVVPSSPPASAADSVLVPSATPLPLAAVDDPAAGLPYGCGGHVFDVRILGLPPEAHLAFDPPADALRALKKLDQRGWWMTHRSATEAEFMTVNGPELFDYIRFRRTNAGVWEWDGEGDCVATLFVAGRDTLRWSLDPERPVGPDSTTIEASVLLPCGSVDLTTLDPPILRFTEDTVLVVFTAALRAGLVHGVVARGPAGPPGWSALGSGRLARPLLDHCAPGPPVTVEVDLGEPLGQRELVDGATWPARDARLPIAP